MVIKVQVCAGELLAHELPDVYEESRIREIRTVCALVRSTSKERDQLATYVDDKRAGVTALRKGVRFSLVIEHGQLDRLLVTGGEVHSYKGHELSETADSETSGVAVFEYTANGLASGVLAVGGLDLVDAEHAPELQAAVGRELELGRDIVAPVYQAEQL